MEGSGDIPLVTVSLLNEMVQEILEANFPMVWVEGEISNFIQAFSGHWYFSLKDANAQVRCAMFKGQNQRVRFKITDGLKIKLRARVSLYAGRGDYQLIVEQIEEDGVGDLQKAFLALKKKLMLEGLFEKDHKQEIPEFPKTIGVITSPKGAAIRDIIITLKRRYPLATVIIYPTAVQGKQAALEISETLYQADRHQAADVLILARGGGSIEDLWGFNEEIVARAIYECSIPLLTGIGHETDITIADFVADLRAPTPTGAAEQASPDLTLWINTFIGYQKQLLTLMQRLLRQYAQKLDWLTRRLRHPKHQIQAQFEKITALRKRLDQAMFHFLQQQKMTHINLMRTLHILSPLTTLERGYSITQQNGHVITDATKIDAEKALEITLAKGKVAVRII
jgi:exodeoxyribonuclease VII large subunit